MEKLPKFTEMEGRKMSVVASSTSSDARLAKNLNIEIAGESVGGSDECGKISAASGAGNSQ